MLVTGAYGFTGRHFISQALSAGYEIYPLSSDLKDPTNLDIELLSIEPEIVVHLAAISFVAHDNPSEFYNTNVVGTLNLLNALAKLKKVPKKILLASSANIYGNCMFSPVNESQIADPINHYAISKHAMEYMAKTYLNQLPLFFTRPFNYTGVGQSELFLIPKLVSCFKKKSEIVELGNLEIEREFNDVRFVSGVYLRLLEKASIGEVYNVCTGTPMKLRDVIDLLVEITGHHIHVKVNTCFVRDNEISTLYGDIKKLTKTIGRIAIPEFRNTLEWMLN